MRFQFRVLCADVNACNAVLDLLKDFEVKRSKLMGYDYTAEKEFAGPDEAVEHVRMIKKKTDQNITNIIVASA